MKRETLLLSFENIQALVELVQNNEKLKEQIKTYLNKDTRSERTDKTDEN